jgi:pyrimidine-nucleoside phosphorylase
MSDMIEILESKRDGVALSSDQIEWFVKGYCQGDIPDYQASALLMAIYIRGMNRRETIDLTLATARSGDQLDLHDVAPFIVDKHSTGGVGDKTTLVVQPVVAACGVPVGKMSGRGLGATGGTLDKMESIAGWTFNLSLDQFKKQLAEIGLVLGGQTADLAPADGMLYALRDVTGTVGSAPLIASSIMSKKLAGGADAIVLDVKVGNGAFMPTLDKARYLADLMVDIGKGAGRKTVALISDMNQPLGHAVGNGLEVKEAIATLNGEGPTDFWNHCVEIAGHLLLLASQAETLAEAKELAQSALDGGKAFELFRKMVSAQGGDLKFVDNPKLLPDAAFVEDIFADKDGYVAGINAGQIGRSCVRLGAGRLVKGEDIDLGVGMVIPIKVGDFLKAGDLMATIHANDEGKLSRAQDEFVDAISWSDSVVYPLPLFYETVS